MNTSAFGVIWNGIFYITETKVSSFWFGDLTWEILFWVSTMLSCFYSHSVALPQSLQLGSLVTLTLLLGQPPVLEGSSQSTHRGLLWHSTAPGRPVLPYGKARALGVQQNRYISQQLSEQSRMTWNAMFWTKPKWNLLDQLEKSKEVFPFRQHRQVNVTFLVKS